MKRTIATALFALAGATLAARDANADPVFQPVADIFEATTDHGWQRLNNYNLGMDFDVLQHVGIYALGIFDDYGNGLQSPHAVRIYDRNTQAVLASVLINPGDGYLRNYFRYVDLPAPLFLDPGAQIVIAAGYVAGNLDRNANSHDGTRDPNPLVFDAPYFDNVGISRFIGDANAFPAIPDTVLVPGPANRYHAGSFRYGTPNPEPGTMLLLGLAGAGAAWRRKRANARRS